jgi:hypothetical protein
VAAQRLSDIRARRTARHQLSTDSYFRWPCLRRLQYAKLAGRGISGLDEWDVEHSTVQNLKELRPGSAGRSELRILFAFDPWRSAILLVAGDKSGNWRQWYRLAIPRAEQLLEIYLKERAQEGEGR